ncbi:MAG: restriction endonuclease subunit S [Prevotellaceae bacterium]|nr:restriction endonuclease subunit S [Prevotellaceae bacterium]
MGLNVDGSAFYPALEPYYNQGSYPFLRVGDIKDYIDYDNCIKVPFEILHKYPTLKHCKKGDIVLTKGGTVGLAGLITQDCCVTRDLIFINSSILPEEDYICLFLYLSTKFSYYQLIRSSSQSVQPHLTITLVRDIAVFKYSSQFKLTISKIYNQSVEKRMQSKSLYRQAEELLLGTIGLKDFQPTEENKNIKSFSESFLATGRLDAEYYQPKYEEIISKVKQQEYDLLGNLVSIKKSIEPGSDVYSDEGLPFLRVADYNKFGISTPEKKLSDTFCKENLTLIENLKPRKETILFSKDGSVGTAYMLREDADFITSGAILHLTVKNRKVLPEYLTLALNSEVVQQQAERDAGGSIILHWRMEEIENVVVPIVDIKIQQQIAELIEKSFYLCAESKRLLDEVKDMVEKEIEKE